MDNQDFMEQFMEMMGAVMDGLGPNQAPVIHPAPPVQVPAVAPVPAQANPVPYSDTPSGSGNDPWDFTSSNGMKMYLAATAPLTTIYDGQEEGLIAFLHSIAARGKAFGWTNVLKVNDKDGVPRNMTTEYGCITRENVKGTAEAFMQARGRDRQASQCIQQMLEVSISKELLNKLKYRKEYYTLNVQPQNANGLVEENVEVGTMMLFELISLVSIETRATIDTLKKKLGNLDKIMEAEAGNIDSFNYKVNRIISELEARNAVVPDIIASLYETYEACGDTKFAVFISNEYSDYLQKKINPTVRELMHSAHERYKVINDRGQWMQMSNAQLDLLTLQATLQQLQQNPPGKRKNEQQGGSVQKKGRQANGNTTKSNWKMIGPKTGEPHAKTVNGKEYIYCPNGHYTKWVAKIDREGKLHKDHCSKAKSGKGNNDGNGHIAMTATTEDEEFQGPFKDESY
jgi:hypothetical protein